MRGAGRGVLRDQGRGEGGGAVVYSSPPSAACVLGGAATRRVFTVPLSLPTKPRCGASLPRLHSAVGEVI